MREYTGLDVLTGAETYERLSFEDRRAFDGEWELALTAAERDFDLEPVVLLVCRWWLASGGEPGRAAYTRESWIEDRQSTWTGRGSIPPRCERTAPALVDVLDTDARVGFANEWVRACREAIVLRDVNAVSTVFSIAYEKAHYTNVDLARIHAETEKIRWAVESGLFEEAGLIPGEPVDD